MQHVYDFTEGSLEMTDLLGAKGAGLADMHRLDLPVPPGFTITTTTCLDYLERDGFTDEAWRQVTEALRHLEATTGRGYGAGRRTPLLVAVRSGAAVSMPGMMDTVLNVGIDDAVLDGLAAWGGERFAQDAHRRFLQMFGHIVLGVPGRLFASVLTEARADRGVDADVHLETADLAAVSDRFSALIVEHAGRPVPADPMEQLRWAIDAVFRSWNNARARQYRRLHRLPGDLGTATTVQTMVFGDMGPDSGTGVAFTRDPATGRRTPYGDYLPQAQGEDVVAGIRNTLTLEDLARDHEDVYRRLLDVMATLERRYRDLCDIEFTVERGELWILQARPGRRTAQAAVRLAVEMVHEQLITDREAVARVDAHALDHLFLPQLDAADAEPVVTGVASSPGAATGTAVFDPDEAVAWAATGKHAILVRHEATPEDFHGMAAAAGILTSHGGKTAHAAVVARGMGKPAVTGAADLEVDVEHRRARAGMVEIAEGDLVTIDGTTGRVFAGALALREPPPVPELATLLEWADRYRTMAVRVNADKPDDASRARDMGAEGVGLARTEYMFMGDRLEVVRRIILEKNPRARMAALEQLEAMQVGDFEGLLAAMDGLPVVVRLLDPPLHEFLPDRRDVESEIARREAAGEPLANLREIEAAVAKWEESNPMLGLRGVRLAFVIPELYRIQVQAALEALRRRLDAGGDPRLEIMVPLVATAGELEWINEIVREEVHDAGRPLEVKIGTMIELPRAALTAAELAAATDFFSFGTNDLTQTTFGLSRDDAEEAFLRGYVEQGLVPSDPFQTLDIAGVGRLIGLAAAEGRAANPSLEIGVCGAHAGDPDSIRFFQDEGFDYVSCSLPRLATARLAAAQAALAAG